MKKISKAILILCLVVMIAAFAFGISFYYRALPQTPQPQNGRIYPLNNHGVMLYMTRHEQLAQELAFGLFGVLAAVAVLIDYFLNPFDRVILSNKTRPPWNHRWGP